MYKIPTLENEDVRIIVEACLAESRRLNVHTTIVVADPGGHDLALMRSRQARPSSRHMARRKAKTAALEMRTTAKCAESKLAKSGLRKFPGYMPVPGGIPIIVETLGAKACLGSIAVAGADTPEQDESIAVAGYDALIAANHNFVFAKF